MRKILILILLLLPAVLWAKKKDKPQHMLPGRWVEIKRLTPDSTVVDFKDTLFMTFAIRDSFTYRLRNGFVYRGKYTYDEEDHLEFGTAAYQVALRRPNRSLILANPKGIYYFIPDTADTAVVIVLDTAEKILPVGNIDQMIGHWTVYKRTIDKDGGGVDFPSQINGLYVTGKGSDEKQGYLYCGNDANNDPGWYVKSLTGDQTLDCDGKNPRSIKVVKCQKGELILSEGGVNYFFKQFK